MTTILFLKIAAVLALGMMASFLVGLWIGYRVRPKTRCGQETRGL